MVSEGNTSFNKGVLVHYIRSIFDVQSSEAGTVEVNAELANGDRIRLDLSANDAGFIGSEMMIAGIKSFTRRGIEVPAHDVRIKYMMFMSMLGVNASGNLLINIGVEPGIIFRSEITPELASTLAFQINSTLARMPVPPQEWKEHIMTSRLKGVAKPKGDVAVHFGQEYPREILEMVGLIIVRACILEDSMVSLLSAVACISRERAEAIFYSSQNNKARMDLIRALVPTSELSDELREDIQTQISAISSLAERRNSIVHGEWEFKNDKFIVREKRSLQRAKSQDPIASLASLSALASGYADQDVLIKSLVLRINQSRL